MYLKVKKLSNSIRTCPIQLSFYSIAYLEFWTYSNKFLFSERFSHIQFCFKIKNLDVSVMILVFIIYCALLFRLETHCLFLMEIIQLITINMTKSTLVK